MVLLKSPRVVSIHVGRVAPLGLEGVPSGFVKYPHNGPLSLTVLGFVGDEQADLRVHGGLEKAVYAYGLSHYAAWREEFPQHSRLLVAGGLGENLAIGCMTEADLCVGDVHGIGSARLQVCQPRQPCFKFALRFGDKNVPKAMIGNGRSGWYYRVLEPGEVSPGDAVELLERPNPDFQFARLVELVTLFKPTNAELEQMSHMPGLASNWRRRAQERLRVQAERGPQR